MTTINFQIDSQFQTEVDATALETVAHSALQSCKARGELTIVITTDEAVQALNLEYRGINAPTDVLSFPTQDGLDDGFVVHLFGQELYLGDIIISFETAHRQAAAMGHTTLEELQLLVIHGVLHLLEYDHLEPAEKARMWAKQAEILALNNLRHVKPTEEAH